MVFKEQLPVGKLPENVLKNHVLRYRGYPRGDVVLWPGFGEDAGAVRASKNVYVLSTDPITGSKNFIGWLSVHASANDVAVSGASPEWFSSTIILPKGSRPRDLSQITRQIHSACRQLRVAIVTGHSEVAPYVSEPTVVGHMIGRLVAGKLVTSHGARPGDHIIMVKSAGLEGTAIIASDYPNVLKKKGLAMNIISRARRMIRRTSVVEEALAFASAGVSAMHDPTEGGLIGGLYELAQASKVGFYVDKSKVLIDPVVAKTCDALKLDPLRLISSGTLLATSPRLSRKTLEKTEARVIGKIVERKRGMLLFSNGREERIKGPVQDELWRFISETG
ncbi:MAG: AIR synthase family protein [Candidatus Caldarchaeum sp.]|nr:AIR synthase family protein [Candidatus Caldarchaeum sp.]MDW8359440.1 AIR synthase family protein [Candidatus Caldarchaeum sp.]